jgi:hypothetical protein
MADQAAPIATDLSDGRKCRSGRPAAPERSNAPVASDTFAPLQSARPPGVRQPPPPDAEIGGARVSSPGQTPPARNVALDVNVDIVPSPLTSFIPAQKSGVSTSAPGGKSSCGRGTLQPEHVQHGRVALFLELRRENELALGRWARPRRDGQILLAVDLEGHRRRREAGTDIYLPYLV